MPKNSTVVTLEKIVKNWEKSWSITKKIFVYITLFGKKVKSLEIDEIQRKIQISQSEIVVWGEKSDYEVFLELESS